MNGRTLDAGYENRALLFGVYAAIVVTEIAFCVFLVARFGVYAYGSFVCAAALIGPLVNFGMRFDRATANGDGTVQLDAPWRHEVVDLRGGFVLKQLRLGKKALLLEVGRRKISMSGFGSLDDVDAWLKEAQVAF